MVNVLGVLVTGDLTVLAGATRRPLQYRQIKVISQETLERQAVVWNQIDFEIYYDGLHQQLFQRYFKMWTVGPAYAISCSRQVELKAL